MHTKNQYKQMAIYMEACESGSMFENLPNNWNSEWQVTVVVPLQWWIQGGAGVLVDTLCSNA